MAPRPHQHRLMHPPSKEPPDGNPVAENTGEYRSAVEQRPPEVVAGELARVQRLQQNDHQQSISQGFRFRPAPGTVSPAEPTLAQRRSMPPVSASLGRAGTPGL